MSVDLLYSEIEDELRSGVRSMLTDRAPWDQVLAAGERADAPFDAALWRTLGVEMGLAGLAVPEALGGGGASLREAAVVCEELGRFVAPVPFLGSSVVATSVLLAADDSGGEGRAADLLKSLAAGERTAALVVGFGTPPPGAGTNGAGANGAGAAFTGEAGRLTGTVTSVADAGGADVLLAATSDGLYAIDATGPGVTREKVTSLDLTRPLVDVTLADAPGTLLAEGPAAAEAVAAGLTAGAALLASEQLGLAESCLDRTVAYLKERYQFGRQIGSFQALKHRAADVWVSVTQARAVARHAAVCVATGDPDAAIATALAQAFCSPVAVKAAEECVQMHGGIGFTWEHPAHLYLKRAKSAAIGFGTAERHQARLADLVDLPLATA